MEESGKVAIGRFVMRNKQYTAAIRAQDGRLVMSTLAYADEVIDPATIEELDGLDEIDVSPKEVKMAEALVESLTADFEPAKYHDEYREQVLDLIRMKAAGEEFEVPEVAAEKPKVVDLMAALEASVKAAKQARGRHPAAVGHEDGGEEEEVCVSAGVETDVEGRRLTLSNLDKVLYPSGFTKAQVIDYYARIAPVMIPHLSGRCLTFRRYPNGSDTTGFFEKRCPSHRPEWVDVATGPGDRRGRCRLLPDRGAGGAGVGGQHGRPRDPRADGAGRRSRRAPRSSCSTSIPGHRRRSSTAARSRSPCATCSPRSISIGCCKTSGSKGLQMYVPLNTDGVTHEGAADFALAVGQVLERQMPRRVTTVMAKARATGEDLRRLEPERVPQDDDRPVLAPCPSRADRVDAGDVGRDRGVRGRRRRVAVHRRRRARTGRGARRSVRRRAVGRPAAADHWLADTPAASARGFPRSRQHDVGYPV